jgi:hypothetical protein
MRLGAAIGMGSTCSLLAIRQEFPKSSEMGETPKAQKIVSWDMCLYEAAPSFLVLLSMSSVL